MRGVFHALCGCDSATAVLEVLDYARGQPWLAGLALSCQQVAALGRTSPVEPENQEALDCLWQLYAASRVRDVLLLAHQPPPADAGSKREFDQALGREEPSFGPVPVATIAEFFAPLGCRPVTEPVFDPILHEIAVCEPAAAPDSPIEVIGHLWPALLIGELVFARGGVRVRAGSAHAVPEVAGRSALHWEYWRRYRDTVDASFWCGSNSQWKTEFRRDYISGSRRVYNLDAASVWKSQIQAAAQHTSGPPGAPSLSGAEETEFIKNRCLLRHDRADEFSAPDKMISEHH
jgi:hypothetical protein